MSKTRDPDQEVWEYVTYAPGHKCFSCSRTVKSLEPVRRGVVDLSPGVTVTVYRHADKCPDAPGVTP